MGTTRLNDLGLSVQLFFLKYVGWLNYRQNIFLTCARIDPQPKRPVGELAVHRVF